MSGGLPAFAAIKPKAVNEVKRVNRVVHDVTSNRPARSSGSEGVTGSVLLLPLAERTMNLLAIGRYKKLA